MKLQSYLSRFANGPWTGSDADLTISVAEYGLAWCFHVEGEERFHPHEIRFAVLYQYPSGPVLDWWDFSKDTDVYKEFDWIMPEEWESHFSQWDICKADFNALPLEQKIFQLFSHYGAEEIFGTPYMGDKLDPASYTVFSTGAWKEFETLAEAEDFARALPSGTFESLEKQNWLTGKDTTLNFSVFTGKTLLPAPVV